MWKLFRVGDIQWDSQRVDTIEPVHRSDEPRRGLHEEGSASTGFARDPRSFRRRQGRLLHLRGSRPSAPGVAFTLDAVAARRFSCFGESSADRRMPITPRSPLTSLVRYQWQNLVTICWGCRILWA